MLGAGLCVPRHGGTYKNGLLPSPPAGELAPGYQWRLPSHYPLARHVALNFVLTGKDKFWTSTGFHNSAMKSLVI